MIMLHEEILVLWIILLGFRLPLSLGAILPPFERYSKSLGEGFGIGNGLSTGKPGDGLIYAVSNSGSVLTLRESDGEQVNVYTRPSSAAESTTTSDWDSLDDFQTGVYAADNAVIMINVQGNYLREFSVEGAIQGQPLIVGGNVYVAHVNGTQGILTVFSNSLNAVIGQIRTAVPFGPVGKDTNNTLVYYGTSNGSLRRLETETLQPSSLVKGLPESLMGRPFATNEEIVLQSPAGIIYWWTDGNLAGDPRFNLTLVSEGASLGSSIAPVRAPDNSNIYVVSGSTLYALANDGVSKGTLRWSSDSSAAKTKPPMAAVDVVYNVETNSGTILQYNATTGSVSEGFPFGNPGSASGRAVLSDDESTILMVLDNGTLISVCVHCDSSDLVPSFAPSTILSQPTFFPSSFSQPPVFEPRFPASTPSQSGGFQKVLSPVLLTASAITSWVVFAL